MLYFVSYKNIKIFRLILLTFPKFMPMKHLLLLNATLFLFIGAISQHNTPDDEGIMCSHAKIHPSWFKDAQDIIQTPLLHDYDVTFYFLDLNVEDNTIDVSGKVTIQADVVANVLDTFALELLNGMNIDSITVNGMTESFIHENDEVFVPLSQPLQQGEQITAVVYYGGTPPSGGFFSGVTTDYNSTWEKNVTWTLSEPFNARQWWPCKQVLEDKADSVWVFLTTGEDNLAGSNGLLTQITPMPENRHRLEWKSKYPINYYLISFAVAEYLDYSIYAKPAAMAGDSILIQNYIYDTPGCLDYYKDGIDQTVEFVELFSDLFGLYPFYEEKYGHCLTELGGGMEHQTMSTMGGFSFGLVAHELGHMWFGDNVTCATWSDIWINEGFATYSDYLANEMINGAAAATQWMQSTHNNVLSQPGGSTYIPPGEITYDNVWRIFDGRLSYRKGAVILHMIRFELQDDDLFFDVLQEFQEEFKDSVATGIDFMNVLNTVSGSDFTQFFDQWYFGEGYPIYDVVWNQDSNQLLHFTATQSASTSTVSLFEMLMEYRLMFDDGTDSTILVYQTDNMNTFSVQLEKTVTGMEVDPNNWVLNKVGSVSSVTENRRSDAWFTFGPNPAGDIINIYLGQPRAEGATLSVMDPAGRSVISDKQISGDRHSLDIGFLSPSIYYIVVRSGNDSFVRKLIKN